MTDLQKCLEYIDNYLNLRLESEEQRALTEAFDGKDGNYKGFSYHSKDFKNFVRYVFGHKIGETLEKIRVALPEFIENPERKQKLETGINKISLDSTMRIGVQTSKISIDDWVNGERGELPEDYNSLKQTYSQFRDLFSLPTN